LDAKPFINLSGPTVFFATFNSKDADEMKNRCTGGLFVWLTFLPAVLALSACQRELHFESPAGTPAADTAQTGIWVIKDYESHFFDDTNSSRSVYHFEYDTTQNQITVADTALLLNNTGDLTARRRTYTYAADGALILLETELLTGQPETQRLQVSYLSNGLPSSFSFSSSKPGNFNRVGHFDWMQVGADMLAAYTDPGHTSVPYSAGDVRFLVSPQRRLKEKILVSQDTAHYYDDKVLAIRNQEGEVTEEKRQSWINGRFLTEDSAAYTRDYSHSTVIHDFFMLWSGKLQWYTEGYAMGFTSGLVGQSNIFEFEKHPLLRKTYYRRINGTFTFWKEGEDVLAYEYDTHGNPVKITQYYAGIRKYETAIVWQRINWQ
jgi:hypothetical protein